MPNKMSVENFQIEYLKSSLSVNTYVGCPLGCEYCTVGEFAPRETKRICLPKESVERLLAHRLFILDRTPITINNRTDPLLKGVCEDTWDILRLLEKRRIRNPKVIISKLALKTEYLEFLESVSGNVYFITSYSDLPRNIERVAHENQLESLTTLSKRKKVKSLHYWRPLIRGLNDYDESLKFVFDAVSQSCDGSIISGLRLNKSIAKKMMSLGAIIDGWDGNTKHKYLPAKIVERIVKLRDDKVPQYPLFRHTSCGICALVEKRDYNFHFLLPDGCLSNCPNLEVCVLGNPPDSEAIQKLLDRIRINNHWSYSEGKIIIEGEINEEERACITHSLEYPVKAEKLSRSPSEGVLRR